MITINTCSECSGKGHYKVYNAYDPKYEEAVICEYCDGTGVADSLEAEEPKDKRPSRDWVN